MKSNFFFVWLAVFTKQLPLGKDVRCGRLLLVDERKVMSFSIRLSDREQKCYRKLQLHRSSRFPPQPASEAFKILPADIMSASSTRIYI